MAKKAHVTSHTSSAAVDALLALAAEQGWRKLSLADIARRAKLSLVELHEHFDSKEAILREFTESLDLAVLKGELPDAEVQLRDRLFEVIMRRFDAMQPHREGIRAILRDVRGDPWMLLCSMPRMLATASLMLEAAGISASGPAGRLRAKGLAAIYLATLRTWLSDDSPDMAKTMSGLDRALRRAEGVVLFISRGRPRSSPRGETAGDEAKV